MSEQTLIHASGRFDGDADVWCAYLARIARKHGAVAVTTTESQQAGIQRKMRRAFGAGWHVAKSGEFMLITRRSRVTHKPVARVLSAVSGLVQWRQMHAATFRVSLAGTRCRVIVTHGPSAIQDGDQWSAAHRQVAAAQTGWAQIGRKVRRGHGVQVVAGDSNLDMHRSRWLRWMTETVCASSVWACHMPKGGTHGDRLIDVAHVKNALIGSAFIVSERQPSGFDHRPIGYTILADPTEAGGGK